MRHILPTVITFKSACTGYVRLSFAGSAYGGEQFNSTDRIDMNNKDSKKKMT
jgi:hypothetical protein